MLEGNSGGRLELIKLQTEVRDLIKQANSKITEVDSLVRKQIVKFKKEAAHEGATLDRQKEIEKNTVMLVNLRGKLDDALAREKGDVRISQVPLKTIDELKASNSVTRNGAGLVPVRKQIRTV